jgi:large subunit ribosomal protein L5
MLTGNNFIEKNIIDLKIFCKESIISKMKNKFGYKNLHQIPYFEKVIVNIGINSSIDKKNFNIIKKDLGYIAGQTPKIIKAKKSISNFKIRKGFSIVGIKVTLRRKKMYDFLVRLIHIVLPRIQGFRGIPENKFDKNGNYHFGIRDYSIFPEIQNLSTRHDGKNNYRFSMMKSRFLLGLGITIVINNNLKNQSESKKLLSLIGFPFKKN